MPIKGIGPVEKPVVRVSKAIANKTLPNTELNRELSNFRFHVQKGIQKHYNEVIELAKDYPSIAKELYKNA